MRSYEQLKTLFAASATALLLAGIGPATAAPAGDVELAAQSQTLADQDLRASITAADVIVVGRVARIQPLTALALAPQHEFVSEHNPNWQEAVIDVQENLRGATGMSQIVVHFPASVDVAWAEYPKLQVGESGTFLLRKDRISAAPTAMLTNVSVPAYVATTPAAVLRTEDTARVRALLNQ